MGVCAGNSQRVEEGWEGEERECLGQKDEYFDCLESPVHSSFYKWIRVCTQLDEERVGTGHKGSI